MGRRKRSKKGVQNKKINTIEDAEEKIAKIYRDPSNPGGFGGIDTLYREVKGHYPGIRKADVRHFLDGDRTYTLFKPRKYKFPTSKTIPLGFMTNLQVDLADLQQLAEQNNGYRFLLIGVDVMSRRLFASPTKSKSSGEMKRAFDSLFAQMPQLPSIIYSDLGGEFVSNEMKKYFKEKGIDQYTTRTGETKAALAENFIKTVKSRLYRWFSEKNSTRWLETVPKIVNALNNKPNLATGISPNNFKPEMTRKVWNKLYKDHMYLAKRDASPIYRKHRYKEGDSVRLAKAHRTFDKGYWPRFTDEIFKINRAVKGRPNYYLLKDHSGEEILGRVYEPELARTRENTSFRVEEIVKKRVRKGKEEFLTKFIGYPKPEWIPKDYFVS